MRKTLLSACLIFFIMSSCREDNLNTEPVLPEQGIETTSGPLYLSLGLDGVNNLSTKATTYEFESLENEVINGKVFIFKESADRKEENAVMVSLGVLKDGVSDDDFDPELLSRKLHYPNVELLEFDYDKSQNYYALAVLNAPSDLKPPMVGDKFGDWAFTPQSSKMVIDVRSTPSNSAAPVKYKYITMANATGQINHTSGEFKPVTLVKIDSDDIRRGKFEDSHVSHTDIYVQRNVAKVTVVPKTDSSGRNILSSEDKLVTIGDVNVQMNISVFFLDVTNTVSYPVQKITGLSWDRDCSHSSHPEFDRIFWAVDPNYSDPSKSKSSGDFSSSELPYNSGQGEPLYCLENTFDIDNMIQGQTTRAIIRCRLDWWGSDDNQARNTLVTLPPEYFYTHEGSMASRKEDVDKEPDSDYGNDFDINGFYIIGRGEEAYISDFKHLRKKLNLKASEIFGDGTVVNLKSELGYGTGNEVDRGGSYLLSQLIDIIPSPDGVTSDQWKTLGEAIGLTDTNTETIDYYYRGFSYYPIRIRHFSDEEGAALDGVTRNRERDGVKVARYLPSHLGRYGVVRNNAYEITINSIHSLGVPKQFPDITDDDTDDMPDDLFMDITVSVNPWQKRRKGFDLGNL